MKAERWLEIEKLYHSALEREASQRASFLDEASGGDEELCREVESLLAYQEQAENFIETPALEVAAELLAEEEAGSVTGQIIGHYKILKRLGSGGMGEVYLAHDARLDRQVALKLLPTYFTRDEERLRRFQQEARAASALNHPNILTIYEIGEVSAQQFIATEFIDGETLRERMTGLPWRAERNGVSDGAIPLWFSGGSPLAGKRLKLTEMLDIASQVAAALAAAHQAGIVHRDIKPENIMVRPDGYVKVLDFGLAKLTERQTTGVDPQAATQTLFKTDPGVVMGTVVYMSPEQARGLDVDARTDIWSLGVVLYEMLAGRVPFEGATKSDVLASILEKEPPLPAQFSGEVPAELERIINKALRKNREERYQTASDLVLDLKSLKQELEVEARLERSSQPGATGRVAATESGGQAVATSQKLAAHTVDIAAAHPTSGVEYLVSEIKHHRRGAVLAVAAMVITAATVGYFYYFAGSSEGIDSIAVLPFVNVNADANAEYLSEGISDSLINDLSQLPSMKKVISLSSVLRYKGKQIDAQAVGRELNVRAVLTGRLIQHGDDLSISVELVDTRDNRRLWGEQYNRKLADILQIQGQIAREISEKLRLRLTGEEQKRLSKRYTENIEAYQLYIQGRYYGHKNTKDGWEKSIEYCQEAIKIDPNYAQAYVGLFNAYSNLGLRGFSPAKEAEQNAERAALKAVELDDALGEAHTAVGYINKSKWDWSGAEKEFKRALELDPNSAEANKLYISYLQDVGRANEAIVYAKRMQELDPLTPTVGLGYAYFGARQYDLAIELYRKAIERNPNAAQAHFFLGEAYLAKRMYGEGVAELQKAVAIENAPERWDRQPMLAYSYAVSGRRDEAQKILDEQKELAKQGRYISPYNFAIIYTGLGDKDRAFEWLDKAYEEHSQPLEHVKSRPLFDSLRSDPRFTDLLGRMKLAA